MHEFEGVTNKRLEQATSQKNNILSDHPLNTTEPINSYMLPPKKSAEVTEPVRTGFINSKKSRPGPFGSAVIFIATYVEPSVMSRHLSENSEAFACSSFV